MHSLAASLGSRAARVAVALAATLAVLGAGLAATAATASTASAPTCGALGLVAWLNTNGNGAAGSVFYQLNFTNLSGRTCTVLGYPGVSAVDVNGHQLGSPAGRDTSRTPHVIRLAPGATATSALRIVDAGNFTPSSCRRTMSAGFRVYPPGATAAKYVPFPFWACSRRGPVYLSVQVVQKA